MTILDDLKAFDVQNSEVALWTFKGTAPKINGHWIEITEALEIELKAIFTTQLDTLSEVLEYSLLVQNNEASVLSIPADETHAGLIADTIGLPLAGRRIRDVKTLRNAKFYVFRMVYEDRAVFAVRKTNVSWKTKSATNILTAFYRDRELDLASDDSFRVDRIFDFFAVDDFLLVANKKNFESILSFRQAHENDFAELMDEEAFIAVFDDLAPLAEFVGINRIHLRRMSAIRAKGFYADEKFMENLRKRYEEFDLNIQFDAHGCIVPTLETCQDIMTALLDHRLQSGFSGNTYDVPNTVQV